MGIISMVKKLALVMAGSALAFVAAEARELHHKDDDAIQQYSDRFSGNIQTQTLKDVAEAIDNLRKIYAASDLLVAFDIDMTLISTTHPVAEYPNIKKHYAVLKEILGTLSPEKQDELLSLFVKLNGSRLVEEESPGIIAKIIAEGIPTIAFTASVSGKLGDTEFFEAFRYDQLKRFGFDFSNAYPHLSKAILTNLPFYRGGHPAYFKGVLSTGGEHSDKGKVLVEFFKLSGHTPKVVFMVDDKVKNLDDIRVALKNLDPSILFVGVHYTGDMAFSSGSLTEAEFRGAVNQVITHLEK
jgi:hypothetical protein